MQMKILTILSMILVLFSYQNCAYVGQTQDASSSSQSSLSSSSLALESAAMSVIKNKCVACHNATSPGGGIDYITDINALKYYRLVLPGEPQISPLYQAISQGIMPPSSPLAQAQTQAIYDWILKGMITGTAPVAPPSALPLAANYKSIYANIIQVNCLGCHSAANPMAGINLSTYAGLMNIVQAGNTAASSFYTSTQAGTMPKNKAPLNNTQLTVIRDWIVAGALNN